MKMKTLTLAAMAALLLVTACKREEVSHARVPKGSSAGTPMEAPSMGGGMPGGGMPGGPMPGAGGNPGMGAPGMGAGEVAPPPPPDPANTLKWTLPTGWTEKLVGGMRYATLTPATPGKVEVSVVMLPGPAGGELANVNRWRGQLGLATLDDAGLAATRKAIPTTAGQLGVYDLISDGAVKTRMTAALLAANNGNTWFLKMTGDADAVAANQADFQKLLETLHFDASGAP